jgi:hypothetical protein
MKNKVFAFLAALVILGACVKDRSISTGVVVVPPVVTTGDTLICYYNCNVDTLVITKTPTFGFTGDSISYVGSYYDTVQPGTTLNAYGADTVLNASSAALRLRNPASDVVFSLPTTGFKNIVLKYAIERTTKGAQTNTVTYTTDGMNYVNTAIAAVATYQVDSTTGWQLISLDFSSDAACNNNPNFKVMITFSNGSANTSGNDRFDNITLWGVKQ